MTLPLFRERALRAQHQHWLGSVSLAQPPRLRIAALGAAIAACAMLAFASCAQYTRRTRVGGSLVPSAGMAQVRASNAGVVRDLAVAEGDRVRAGDMLMVVANPAATRAGGDTGAALQAALEQRRAALVESYTARRRSLQAQLATLQGQLDGARAEQGELDAELATRRRQVESDDGVLERLRILHERGFVSDLQLQQQQTTNLDHLGAAQALQRQAITARREMAQLQQSKLDVPRQLDALDAEHQRELAALEQESVASASQREVAIRAPIDGTVSALLGLAGQSVQAGQTLLSIVPGDGELEAHLLVPSRAVGFIRPGDSVLLRYRAFPFEKFGQQRGVVARISRSGLGSGELAAIAAAPNSGEAPYRVVVKLERQTVRAYGRELALTPGQTFEADVLAERRHLWEWVIAPLYSIDGEPST